MEIIMVRHGMPEGADKGRRFLGSTDEPLCAEGKKQAENIGRLLAGMTTPGRIRLAASTLLRSLQTAEIINEHLGCDHIETCVGLREIDMGSWDGEYHAQIIEDHPEEYDARGRDLWNYRTPEGETFAEAGGRFTGAVSDIVRRSSDDETVIIVAHGGVIRAGLSLMTDKPFDEWMKTRIPYTGVIVLNGAGGVDGNIRLEIEKIIDPEEMK